MTISWILLPRKTRDEKREKKNQEKHIDKIYKKLADLSEETLITTKSH